MTGRLNLNGKVALVTGSTSGIGLGIVRALAAQGCSVVFNGFGMANEIENLREQVAREFGVSAIYHAADLSRPDECAGLVEEAERRFGNLDILVNNAGIQHVAPVEDFPLEQWDAVLAVNLSAAFHTIRAALPGMRQRGWGRIINIASVHGLVGSAGKAAYVAAKHGLVGLTRVVALETAGAGITCNAICPGWVLTPLVELQIESKAMADHLSHDEAARTLIEEKQPSGSFTTTKAIGEFAVFLCTDAAQNLTGAALPIDGGWTSQ